ncbi:MAG: tryptophan synthase subunit alpha [Kiritimatiellae bacterium]|nr:tryptophan synthase subunit alpha [Kiritimatiellia bacterium]
MNRITEKFAELKTAGRKGLVGYMTAGDPDLESSERNICEAIDNGVDILELGMPFSDPTADGPAIQEASKRALDSGMDLSKVIQMVARLRRRYNDIPIILFGYANPLFSAGYENICADAADAGVDGMLVVDLPFEESEELRVHMDKHDICFIPLVAPTTSGERMLTILNGARGFVYYVMVIGVTGKRESVASGIAEHVGQIRNCTDLPIAVGFGVSNGAQAAEAARTANAVVVGSALVKAAQSGTLVDVVRDLRSGLDNVETNI